MSASGNNHGNHAKSTPKDYIRALVFIVPLAIIMTLLDQLAPQIFDLIWLPVLAAAILIPVVVLTIVALRAKSKNKALQNQRESADAISKK